MHAEQWVGILHRQWSEQKGIYLNQPSSAPSIYSLRKATSGSTAAARLAGK